jgi:sec-independent protein translocase protein TatB
MFDLSWAHMGIIIVVALIALGPKELPNALRTVTSLMKSARKLANEFQSGVNEIIREADLEEARKKIEEIATLNPNQIQQAVEKAVDPTGEVKSALTMDAEPDPTGPVQASLSETGAEHAAAIAAPAVAAGADVAGEDPAVEAAAAAPVVAPTPAAEPAPTPESAGAEKN